MFIIHLFIRFTKKHRGLKNEKNAIKVLDFTSRLWYYLFLTVFDREQFDPPSS